eukprot:959641-Pyramimonas_sp.AAC.1
MMLAVGLQPGQAPWWIRQLLLSARCMLSGGVEIVWCSLSANGRNGGFVNYCSCVSLVQWRRQECGGSFWDCPSAHRHKCRRTTFCISK